LKHRDAEVSPFESAELWHLEASEGPIGLPPKISGGLLAYATCHGLPIGFHHFRGSDFQDPDRALKMAQAMVDDGEATHRSLRDDLVAAPDNDGTTGAPPCARERLRLLTDPPPITVVIPTKDRPERLRRCLASIEAVEYPSRSVTVIVVDNASGTDETRHVVDEFQHRLNIRYAREDLSGSASARNCALPLVETDLIAFTDDDALVDRFWLSEIVRSFRIYPSAACVTGLLLPRSIDTPAQLLFEEWGGFSRGFNQREFRLDTPDLENPLYPYAAGIFGSANNLAYRTDDLLNIGGFCNSLGNGTPALGGVDSEVLLRTVLRGRTIIYQPTSLVWHEHRSTYEGLRTQLFGYGVGLTAYLTKTMLDDPKRIGALLTRLPSGIRFALSPDSTRNNNRGDSFPPELSRLEVLGMLYGPFAYARSRFAYGKHNIPFRPNKR
jgi:O-antigen biosynthesis protein